MDPEETSLRPCKPLPFSTGDRYASQNMMGQHPSSPSVHPGESTQGTIGFPQKLGLQNDEYSECSDEDMAAPAGKQICPKGKEREDSEVVKEEGPMQLLDLPLDILKDILKEVTHTNDLANLALVSSTLHGVVTPMIYSRFDIVWPDSLSSAEPRAGVDALTYGLATLVMREDLFNNVVHTCSSASREPCQSFSCTHCGSTNYLTQEPKPLGMIQKTRRGNYFSQFTKKFSLGNGPADWVQEYLVTKESGKMLGTLVALSVARMPNLETFIWDMPTGILRDIWISLASLGDYQPSKLEKLWVRLHDNKAALQEAGIVATGTAPQASQVPSGPSPTLPAPQSGLRSDAEIFGVARVVWSNHHVESPNFSIVPALRSLTVLDIDEIKYLLELSVLLGRSINTLRELRLGMTSTLHTSGYVRDAPEIQPLFNGGVFSLIMSKIYNHMSAISVLQLMRPKYDAYTGKPLKCADTGSSTHPQSISLSNTLSTLNLRLSEANPALGDTGTNLDQTEQELPAGEIKSSPTLSLSNLIDPALLDEGQEDDVVDDEAPGSGQRPQTSPLKSSVNDAPLPNVSTDSEPIQETDVFLGTTHSAGTEHGLFDSAWKLKLETLEIEKVTLSSPVLGRAIDFRVLTSLTLLQCGDSAALWRILMREYPPRKSIAVSTTPQNIKSPSQRPRLRRKPSSESLSSCPEYQLHLKRIHTDTVSKDLVAFIKTTLAPNSLEWMFLQDNPSNPSSVSLDTIYRGPLRRHRASLTKVLVDSACGPATSRSRSTAAKKWMFSREVLTFVTSGKMSKLRELAMAVEYKDWHFFLQKLPNIPHLRSLYVPHIADHPYGSSLNYKEFAMGAVDTVALRPEIQLCYLGIRNKCYEILETKNKHKTIGSQSSLDTEGDTDDDGQDTDHHDDDDDSDDGAPSPPPPAAQVDDDSDAGERSPLSEDEDDSVEPGKRKVRFKLREILFYDDKISIFKARHGRL